MADRWWLCVGRAASCGGFYGKVGRRTLPTGRQSLVGSVGRFRSACCGEGRRQLAALSLPTRRMWSDADKLLLNATPRIFTCELSRVMLESGGGSVELSTFLDSRRGRGLS